MSLLMDALRQTGQNPPAGSPLPVLALHLDSVDADLASVSSTAAARKPAPESLRRDRQQAAEAPAADNDRAAERPPESRAPRWTVLALGGLAALGIGGGLGWQLQALSGGSLAIPAPSSSRLATAAVPPPPLAPAEIPAPLPLLAEPIQPATVTEAAPGPQRTAGARPKPAPIAPAEPESPIRLSTGQVAANTTLNRAYEALQADNLGDARRDYEQVLRSDAKNTDALLGLATIATLEGQADSAAALYRRVLEADPRDGYAQAGLINLKGQGDPALSESHLKTLLASQPESPALNFALGNLYARQTRWSDAQQAYFRAYTAEPDNATHLFNLAVSLDHLHQNRLAAQFYAMTLNATGTHAGVFDRKQVQSRLLELQP